MPELEVVLTLTILYYVMRAIKKKNWLVKLLHPRGHFSTGDIIIMARL